MFEAPRSPYLVPFELEQHRQRIRCVRAVVDDEHAACGIGRGGRAARLRRRLDARQADRDRRAAAVAFALDSDGAAMHRQDAKIAATQYYDVVNFARRLTVPGLYSWGFNDETCPPTSMYSAYNVIPGQKKLLLAIETGHNNVPEQVAEVDAWLQAFLKAAPAGN